MYALFRVALCTPLPLSVLCSVLLRLLGGSLLGGGLGLFGVSGRLLAVIAAFLASHDESGDCGKSVKRKGAIERKKTRGG